MNEVIFIYFFIFILFTIHTVLPGLIRTAKFVVWSYSQIVEFSLLFTNLDPIVDQAPFGVFLCNNNNNNKVDLI